MRQHIYFHRLKYNKKTFYYCSFCGYNHRYRTRIIVHMAKNHPKNNSSNNLMLCHVCRIITEKKIIFFLFIFYFLISLHKLSMYMMLTFQYDK